MEKGLISIIVPIYKVEEYFDRCIKSIVNQTYKNLEIILVDDGSPDNCPKLCDEWAKKDKRIKVIHKENSGVSEARNTGIDNANGEFICFVDSDDYLQLDFIEKLISKQIVTNADIVYCKYNLFDASGKFVKVNEDELELFISSNDIKYLYTSKIACAVWRKIYRINIIKNQRFRSDLRYGEDLYFTTELTLKNIKTAYVNEYLYNYFINNSSVTHVYSVKNIESHYQGTIANSTLLFERNYNELALYLEFDFYRQYQLLYKKVKGINIDVKRFNDKIHYKAYMKLADTKRKKIIAYMIRHNFTYLLRFLKYIKKKLHK